MFQGLYKPFLPPGASRSDLIQNFTVNLPADFPTGTALVSVAHFGLIIVSNQRYKACSCTHNNIKGVNPFLEVVNTTIFVV